MPFSGYSMRTSCINSTVFDSEGFVEMYTITYFTMNPQEPIAQDICLSIKLDCRLPRIYLSYADQFNIQISTFLIQDSFFRPIICDRDILQSERFGGRFIPDLSFYTFDGTQAIAVSACHFHSGNLQAIFRLLLGMGRGSRQQGEHKHYEYTLPISFVNLSFHNNIVFRIQHSSVVCGFLK